MLWKIFSSIIIIVVLYILWVFLSPNLTDWIGEMLGIASVNTALRNFKNWMDSTSDTLLQIKDATGAINGVRQVVDQANQGLNETVKTINNIRQVGEQKMGQVQKTVDSVQKASQAINEVQSNLSNLTSLTGGISDTGGTTNTGNAK